MDCDIHAPPKKLGQKKTSSTTTSKQLWGLWHAADGRGHPNRAQPMGTLFKLRADTHLERLFRASSSPLRNSGRVSDGAPTDGGIVTLGRRRFFVQSRVLRLQDLTDPHSVYFHPISLPK